MNLKQFFTLATFAACLAHSPAPVVADAVSTPPAGAVIPMNDAAILYSPFNWSVTSTGAQTINAGAYLKVLFTGTSVSICTATADDAAPYPEIVARVDGGPWVTETVGPVDRSKAGWGLSRSEVEALRGPVFAVATGLLAHRHLLELVVKSTTETKSRWSSSQTMVSLTGLVLDPNAGVFAPVRKPYNILIYGDSITEGVRTEGTTQPFDTDRNDATHCWSWSFLNAARRVGVVGFGFGIYAPWFRRGSTARGFVRQAV